MLWTVASKKDESAKVKTIRFTAHKPVSFKPGQYFILHDQIEGIDDCRAYSASSSPEREYVDVTVKLVPQPYFSKHLQELPIGYELECEGPLGDFYFDDSMKEIVLIGAGSGMAPLRSIIEYIIGKNIDTSLTVICSDKTKESLIFREELEKLAESGKMRLFMRLTQEAEAKRIDTEFLNKAIPDFKKPIFFVCGPPRMVDSSVSMLLECGASSKQIRTEKF